MLLLRLDSSQNLNHEGLKINLQKLRKSFDAYSVCDDPAKRLKIVSVYSKIIPDKLLFDEFMDQLSVDYLDRNHDAYDDVDAAQASSPMNSTPRLESDQRAMHELQPLRDLNISVIVPSQESEPATSSQPSQPTDLDSGLGDHENRSAGLKRKRPNKRIHLDDFKEFKLDKADSWQENYGKLQTELDNVRSRKKIDDFKYNSADLDGALGFIVSRHPFMKLEDDPTGYVSDLFFWTTPLSFGSLKPGLNSSNFSIQA